MNDHNIVIHASDLPEGRGFSPLQWQVLEGKSSIPLTLFEAVEEMDDGPYYLKDELVLDGSELYDELRAKLGNKIVELCCLFIDEINNMQPIDQKGQSTVYRRRTDTDDEINIHESIAAQFDHFRIADNDNHPLWFNYKGHKYLIRVDKQKED